MTSRVEAYLHRDTVATPQVALVEALMKDQKLLELDEAAFCRHDSYLKMAKEGLRSSMAEGDVSSAAFKAMEFTGIDRRDEI
jgi:hypothetical protein